VLESGITLIQDGKLYCRGQDALKLAQERTLEQVAELFWGAEATEPGHLFQQPPVLTRGQLAHLRRWAKDGPLPLLQTVLPLGSAADLASYDLRPAAVRLTGARIVRLLAAGEVIRMALVLCADHELNASAFVARCAASAGASPYDVVSAALATLKGHRHGGATERLSALLAEAGTPERCRAVLANRLRRGESVPGFGHPLYPAGDPRAALLLSMAEAAGNEEEWRFVRHLTRAGSELLQARPNLDFGLVAVARTYGLTEDAPLLLFALGRVTGWIGLAIEQYASGELIRPRPRYTGPSPGFENWRRL
jgi:citrate synthase